MLGNQIQGGGGYGVYVTGVVTGTQVQNNAISGNASDGVALVKARKVTIGGNSSTSGSQVAPGPGQPDHDQPGLRPVCPRRVQRLRGAGEHDRGERPGERQPEPVPRHHLHPEVRHTESWSSRDEDRSRGLSVMSGASAPVDSHSLRLGPSP